MYKKYCNYIVFCLIFSLLFFAIVGNVNSTLKIYSKPNEVSVDKGQKIKDKSDKEKPDKIKTSTIIPDKEKPDKIKIVAGSSRSITPDIHSEHPGINLGYAVDSGTTSSSNTGTTSSSNTGTTSSSNTGTTSSSNTGTIIPGSTSNINKPCISINLPNELVGKVTNCINLNERTNIYMSSTNYIKLKPLTDCSIWDTRITSVDGSTTYCLESNM
jgi:hypothetical protein